jgi:hypothetical protein
LAFLRIAITQVVGRAFFPDWGLACETGKVPSR